MKTFEGGITPVESGTLVAAVTFYQMTAPPPRPEQPARSALRLDPINIQPNESAADYTERYRSLFRKVGAPWLWFTRLKLSDADLLALLNDPDVHSFMVTNRTGVALGLLELDFRVPTQCEIAFFGLITAMTGHGHGRWLMEHALNLGWKDGIKRVWLQSSTLDHPAASRFYQAQGFIPYARGIEIFPDPRLTGLLPETSAPHIPLISPLSDHNN